MVLLSKCSDCHLFTNELTLCLMSTASFSPLRNHFILNWKFRFPSMLFEISCPLARCCGVVRGSIWRSHLMFPFHWASHWLSVLFPCLSTLLPWKALHPNALIWCFSLLSFFAALENTQTELIELKLRYEEVTAAK